MKTLPLSLSVCALLGSALSYGGDAVLTHGPALESYFCRIVGSYGTSQPFDLRVQPLPPAGPASDPRTHPHWIKMEMDPNAGSLVFVAIERLEANPQSSLLDEVYGRDRNVATVRIFPNKTGIDPNFDTDLIADTSVDLPPGQPFFRVKTTERVDIYGHMYGLSCFISANRE